MAYNTNDRHVFFTAEGLVKTVGFKYQFLKEKKRRDTDKAKGIVDEKELPPFSPALLSAAVTADMLDLAEVSAENRKAIHKWAQSAITGSYAGTPEEQAQKERYVSYLIDKSYSDTSWWRAINSQQEKNTGVTLSEAFADYNVAPPTITGLFMDYAWYRENLMTRRDPKCAKTIKGYEYQKYEVRLLDTYPETFIACLSERNLSKLGATEDEIKAFQSADVSSPAKLVASVDALMMPLAKRRGYDFTTKYDGEGRYVQKPLYTTDENGVKKPDYVAAMKYYRYIKANNAKVYRLKMNAITNSGCKTEAEAIEKRYLSPNWKENLIYPSNEFLEIAFTEDFLKAVGVPDNGRDAVMSQADNWKSSDFNSRKDAVSCLMKNLGGSKAPLIPAVRSALTMSLEFGSHSTPEERFIEEFKRQNNIRKESHWQKPFSDKFILACRNRHNLERIGMPAESIEAIMNFELDENNLTPLARKSFSNLLGGNDGIRKSQTWRDSQSPNSIDNYQATVSKNSSMKEIYSAIIAESSGCYQLSQREANADDHYAYVYSDNLLEALFRTDVLAEVVKDPSWTDERSLTTLWIKSLPDDCVLCDPKCLDCSKEALLAALKIENGTEKTKIDYVAKVFSMLVRSGYQKGNPDYWKRLNKGQRAAFAMAINRDVKEMFQSWANRSEQNASYLGRERRFNSKGSTAPAAKNTSQNSSNYGEDIAPTVSKPQTREYPKRSYSGRAY